MRLMTYEDFKRKVEKEIKNYMPESFSNAILKTFPVNKTNVVLDGITIIPQDNNGTFTTPTFYINDLFEEYLKIKDFKILLSDFVESYLEHLKKINQEGDTLARNIDLSDTSKIIFQLINTTRNEAILESAPHREFLDLSIIYRYMVEIKDDHCASFIIYNDTADKMNLSEEQLFELATKNTPRLFPLVVQPMDNILKNLFKRDDMPDEIVEIMASQITDKMPMFILSNNIAINGATSILYEDTLYNLAIKLNSDLYILSSSIHECIAVKANDGNPKDLAEMVKNINSSEVNIEERLSNKVYFYNKTLRKLSLTTNTQVDII